MRCRERRHLTPTPTRGRWLNSGSVSNEFGLTTIQRKSCFSMTMQGRTNVWGLGQLSAIWLHSVTPSTLPPRSRTLISSYLESWRMWPPYEVWDWWRCDSRSETLAMWAGHGMVTTRHAHTHTHTCSSLAQGRTRGRRLCGNIGYEVKPSLFCDFRDQGINIYWEKK
jgi:hypothetical protein